MVQAHTSTELNMDQTKARYQDDRACIRINLNFKRKYDRTCIQKLVKRLFEIQAYRAERGKSRKGCIFLPKSEGSDRNIHGSKENR